MGNPRPTGVLLASHLVLHGYGHWLPNDPRGSGSTELRKLELGELGEIHTGRKPPWEQPFKSELRAFYRRAKPLLQFDPLWYRDRERELIATAFKEVVSKIGYTVWSCAICSNHAHLIVRAHRDRAENIWSSFARASTDRIRKVQIVPAEHPVWSHRPYKVFLHTWQEIVDRVAYVEDNPGKERLAKQVWDFVQPLPKSCEALLPSGRRPRDPRQ
ncbi:hypothetical protein [Humisphaera borealis]|uniref:Transposase IS200-like domain-containing protein n=1 Tax=Humisphaera borealis TaxID=2807512 RepID=A0A7M2WVH6_9BACT|nr:hypothetical protein [Humisphaera borealis]QOV89324.1 hypothetical protein IPV69_24470 [Humisphaera borealis]